MQGCTDGDAMLKFPSTFLISSAELVSVIRVWVEEERGTGGNGRKGGKREGNGRKGGRKVPASVPEVSERGHIVKQAGPLSAVPKRVSAAE